MSGKSQEIICVHVDLFQGPRKVSEIRNWSGKFGIKVKNQGKIMDFKLSGF